MTINEHVESFLGLPVRDWRPGEALDAAHAWRIAITHEGRSPGPSGAELVAKLLADAGAPKVRALVIGPWSDEMSVPPTELVALLIAGRARLAALAGLFVGDLTFEESEISWIQQMDLAPLAMAFPQLVEFVARGGQGLRLAGLKHERLRALTLQTGGLAKETVRDVCAAQLPALERLELWLGMDDYGGDCTPQDLAPLFAGDRFPRLASLGLRNAQDADEFAAAVAKAPLLARLQALDLSMGTLGDEGAQALLASAAVKRLAQLNLRHHYLSDAMQARLRGLGPAVDLAERQKDEDEDDRYCEVGE